MPPPSPVSPATVSSRTQGLALFIQEAVSQLRNRSHRESGTAHPDGLLFLGNWHDAHPRLLFHDPVLEPVDKVVWAVIRHHAEPGKATAFPNYPAIARYANVSSSATVARAIMILRITRWMSLCARVRDRQGRYRGNVYALHDEPVTVGDALHLDPVYLQLLQQLADHHHARVRQVATVVLATIEETLTDGANSLPKNALLEQCDRRLSALRVSRGERAGGGFYSVSARQLQRLQTEPAHGRQNVPSRAPAQNRKAAAEHRVQILKPAEKIEEKEKDNAVVQNLNMASVSSSCVNNKTTTTGAPQNLTAGSPAAPDTPLHFPTRLRPDERRLARLYLAHVPEPQRQDVLDELQGRLGETRGGPIRNPIGYLAKLCHTVRDGAFQLTSLGLQVRARRHRSAVLATVTVAQEQALTRQAQAEPVATNPLAQRLDRIRQRRQDDSPMAQGVHGAPPGKGNKN